MIHEAAILPVPIPPRQEAAFRSAFRHASATTAALPGYQESANLLHTNGVPACD